MPKTDYTKTYIQRFIYTCQQRYVKLHCIEVYWIIRAEYCEDEFLDRGSNIRIQARSKAIRKRAFL